MSMDQVEDAILEYLEHYDFVHTAECLLAEREQHRLKRKRAVESAGLSVKERILLALQEADEDRFVRLWTSHVPEKDRMRDLGLQIEFDIRSYLAVSPLFAFTQEEKNQEKAGTTVSERRVQKAKDEARDLEFKSRMHGLRRFIEGPGRMLANHSEYCSLFALPHCEDPAHHPMFKYLFAADRLEFLERRLSAFLDVTLKASQTPSLCKFLQGVEDGKATEGFDVRFVKSLFATAAQTLQVLEAARERLGQHREQIFSDRAMDKLAHRMAHYTGYMDAVERGEHVHFEELDLSFFEEAKSPSSPLLQACSNENQWVQDRGEAKEFKQEKEEEQELEELEESKTSTLVVNTTDTGELEYPLHSPTSPKSPEPVEGFPTIEEAPILAPLDYVTIKSDLGQLLEIAESDRAAERQACRMLQALRWRLSRTPPWQRRERVIELYLENDLLGLQGDISKDGTELGVHPLLLRLLDSSSELVKEYTVRLLNYLVTSYKVRAYLEPVATELVSWLHEILAKNQWHFPMKGNPYLESVLACLQKLSLNSRFSKETLVSLDSLQLLFELLSAPDTVSRFASEHIAALLLNVMLLEEAADRIGPEVETCVQSIESLLASPQQSNLHPYAVGILFAMLRSSECRAFLLESQNTDADHVKYLAGLEVSQGAYLNASVRKQVAFLVDILTRGENAILRALSREEAKQQASEEDTMLELERQDILPEDDLDEHPSLRQSNARPSERIGERLLVFAYPLHQSKNTKESKEGKEDDRDRRGRKSPVMKMFETIPDEMQHKPKLALETPR